MDKSPKKAKVYFIIAQVLFVFSALGTISSLAKPGVSLYALLFTFAATILWNPLIYLSFMLYWRSAKNLSLEELSKRKFWLKYYPRVVVMLFVLAVIVMVAMLLLPFLIPIQHKN